MHNANAMRNRNVNNVTLLEGIFKMSQEKGKEYLQFLDIDRLMAPCYEAVSLQPKAESYGGWEKQGIRGHSVGHWLSAASAMLSVSFDEELKKKLDYAVDELAYVQSFDEEGYVSGFPRNCFDKVFSGEFDVQHFNLAGWWVPWYSIHKIYAGLIDAYSYTGSQKALDIVVKLADWAKRGTDRLSDEQFQKMLICEHGGMSEAMADLYTITRNKAYLDLAKRFCHQVILKPLANEIDELEGKHANTQIPKVIGAARLYELTGEETYKKIALFFWKQVVDHRSYVIGGNSKGEHFNITDTEELGITTAETCNTYNMLKLTEHLFSWSHHSKYMDYYERALYNHILASQDPNSGMKTYFVSTQPGHFKVYCSPENSFWCCTGTGMENPARYTQGIYYGDQDALYINLFISSIYESKKSGIKIRQETSFPEEETTKFILEKINGGTTKLCIRHPEWMDSTMLVWVNGEALYGDMQNGYLTIKRCFQEGDVIEVKLSMSLHLYRAKDQSNKAVIMYGPIVLAGSLGREGFPETDILEDHLKYNNHPLISVPDLVIDEWDLNQWIKRVPGSLKFETEAVGQPGDVRIQLIPFYELHHERYTLYWNLLSPRDYQEFLKMGKEKIEKVRRLTVDVVHPNEQQSEVDHYFRSENSHYGYLNVVHKAWRDARDGGYFSYEMAVDPSKSMNLVVTYFGNDGLVFEKGKVYKREFEILVDQESIAFVTLKPQQKNELMDVVYELPLGLTQGKDKVEVKFRSFAGRIAGGIYEVKMLNGEPLTS